ncbi:hypothetical protein [Streptomyces sp. KMM 9044]|uniref:hypothetical protein n=1 Tax=Streptomyces sp. KMM 9044 TaxID=2744474 RepID=UPI002151DAC9|nr:hypothetical protein [Streptomyces sp. KMM 9044]WAX80039.1 hypothetical protein HUV60_022615 [Streptomyces sp. KMM 9044]
MPEPGGVYDDSDRPPDPGPLRQAQPEQEYREYREYQEYSEAFAEWDGSEGARLRDQVSGDGITGQVR